MAANQNYPEAIWVLGLCYKMGIGCQINEEKARQLTEKAAKLGYLFATEHLVDEAEKAEQYYEAIAWLKLAETQGEKNAKYRICRLERKINESLVKNE